MSYRGRPSKGCESCRSRKVKVSTLFGATVYRASQATRAASANLDKCDETKPVCNRCSKVGHECKYRDPADLLFRNQTAFAAHKAEESWRKRSKSHQRASSEDGENRQPHPSSHHSPPIARRSMSSENSRDSTLRQRSLEDADHIPNLDDLTIGPEVRFDLRRLAYERFVYDFVIFDSPGKEPDKPSGGLFNFVPPLYHGAAEGSCLATVVEAVAYANFANRCNAPHAQRLAEENRAKGIRLLQQTIADKKLAPTDEALCAVYLMGMYEVCVHEVASSTNHGAPDNPH